MPSEFRLFEDLSEQEVRQLAPYFSKRLFHKKQRIRFPAYDEDYIYQVRSGRVKVSYLSPEGKEIIVTILNPGDIYSLHSEANSTVLETAEIWYIGARDFKFILAQNPGLSMNLIKILGRMLKNTNDVLLNLAFKEVNSRLASLLLKICREKGVSTKDGIAIEPGLTHEEIASLIGSTRQTVTTVLNRFEKSGIIETCKKKIIVKDIRHLAELSF